MRVYFTPAEDKFLRENLDKCYTMYDLTVRESKRKTDMFRQLLISERNTVEVKTK